MIVIEPQGADAAQIHYSHQNRLPMWTVYSKPTDHPKKVVARMFLTLPATAPTNLALIGDSLSEVREALPPGLHRLERNPCDEPQIVETWL